eukprot:CAMPEP_0181451408 /NCGR_PEP_ID=MMETSP1110-20121109/28677_1 /TAXON_ID=174948 /ORGANISM="Symbiodinium sp., Strain CCMP421" /LENGTH=153 /DNA_ID=CAMNT_0023575661 /DNA_START=239 /DNA_END=700 /DNA_ORIENTATION=+
MTLTHAQPQEASVGADLQALWPDVVAASLLPLATGCVTACGGAADEDAGLTKAPRKSGLTDWAKSKSSALAVVTSTCSACLTGSVLWLSTGLKPAGRVAEGAQIRKLPSSEQDAKCDPVLSKLMDQTVLPWPSMVSLQHQSSPSGPQTLIVSS